MENLNHQSPLRFRKYMVDLWGSKWEKDLLKQSVKQFKGTYITVENYLNNITKNYV